MLVIRVIKSYVPVNRQPCGYTCPKCHQKGGLQMTIFQRHIEHVGLAYEVTNKTSGGVRCDKCQQEIAAVDWTDDIEAFYLKTAKESVLEKPYKRSTWFAKLAIVFTALSLVLIVFAFVFNDEIKAYNAARKLAEENRQDVVLTKGNKIELRYEHLYMTFHQGQDKGAGVQWFEVVDVTNKAYKLRKIAASTKLSRASDDEVNGIDDAIFEMKKAKSGAQGFTVVGLNGAEGMYYQSEVTQIK